MFAHLFHIRPWEHDRLTYQEFEALAKAADDYLKEK